MTPGRALATGILVLALAGLAPRGASALLYDMDQVSIPRFTEPGAQSVQPCSYLAGATPSVLCEATGADFGPTGYTSGGQPVGDFRAAPQMATAMLDLWSDGHRVLGTGATLVIGGLLPGAPYDVTVMSHFPVGTAFDSTIFQIEDLDPFEIQNVPLPPSGSDLFALQARTVPVLADAAGTITIFYRSENPLGSGVLNGVELRLVPEPTTLVLLGSGLAWLGGRSRRRRPFRTGAGAALVASLVAAAPAGATLVDQEPGNDERAGTPTVLSGAATLVAEAARFSLADTATCQALTGCDLDFVRLSGLSSGDFVMITTTLRPDLGLAEPDTLLGLFDASETAVALDENLELASRLGFRLAAGGDYSFGVTGGVDDGFLGDHSETGPYELSVAILPASGAGATLSDAEPANNSRITTPTVITRSEAMAVYAGSYALTPTLACTAETGPCDRDYVRVTGLQAGDLLSVATFLVGDPGAPEPFAPDTFVGVFDAAGLLLDTEFDLDAPSKYDFVVPADGNYTIGVTGTFDSEFLGEHFESGPYKLMISVFPVPEGSAAGLGAAALAALAALRRAALAR